MAEPVPFAAPQELKPFLADVARRLQALEVPQKPTRAFPCLKAELPPAASYAFCIVQITDLNIIGYSDGTNWRRADTGAIA